MISYLARRLVTSVIVVIGVSIFIFLLLHAIYPSPARQVLGLSATAGPDRRLEQVQRLRRPGDRAVPPVHEPAAARQPGVLLRGEPERARAVPGARGRSVYLSGISLLIAVIIALPLGIFQAVKRNTLGDNVATSAAFILYSMPSFFLGLILIQVFAISLPIFNFEASQSTNVWYGHGGLVFHDAADHDAGADRGGRLLPVHAIRRPWTCWPRTTSRWPGPRACPSGWSCRGTWSATPACRW